jgi:hypothetical protein
LAIVALLAVALATFIIINAIGGYWRATVFMLLAAAPYSIFDNLCWRRVPHQVRRRTHQRSFRDDLTAGWRWFVLPLLLFSVLVAALRFVFDVGEVTGSFVSFVWGAMCLLIVMVGMPHAVERASMRAGYVVVRDAVPWWRQRRLAMRIGVASVIVTIPWSLGRDGEVHQ